MKITKSQLTINGDRVDLSVPFAKVDKEQRLVAGWATMNNVDRQKDVVTTEASVKAFEEARGNLREMHGPVAVGKVVDFKVDTFHDTDGTKYEGIYVTAYVSKGAQDTWEKVLDGTLTGFSIGGNITDSSTQWSKADESAVRIVKAYDLIELSLVDNPANPLSNIFSIQKAVDGSTHVDGMVADVSIENAFLCRTDEVARTEKAESLDCVICGNEMEFLGWVESAGDMNKTVFALMNKALSPETDEGGVQMSKNTSNENENVETPAEVVETVPAAEEVEQTEVASDEVAAEEAPAVEVETPEERVETSAENDIEKMITDMRDTLTKRISEMEENLETVSKNADTKMHELQETFSEAMQKFDSARSDLDSVTKRLGVVEGKSAIRKSSDLESPVGVKKFDVDPMEGAFFG